MRWLFSKIIAWLLVGKNAIRNSIIVGCMTFLAEVTILLLAGGIDGIYWINGDSVGLFEHAGIWAILFGDLFIAFLMALLVKSAKRISSKTPTTHDELTYRYLRYARYSIFKSFDYDSKYLYLLIWIIAIGALFWVNNAYQTIYPERYYGNDVFDSINHEVSYIGVRIILATSWVFFYPIAVFVSLIIGFSLNRVLLRLRTRKKLEYNTLHPDNCGGFSYLGNLNVIFIGGVFIVYFELVMVLMTHDRLNPGLLSGFIFASILFFSSTFIMLYPIYSYLREVRSKLISSNYRRLNKSKSSYELMHYGLLVNSLSFSPYNQLQQSIVTVARAVPIAIAIFKYYQTI
jgi:hypothetical protein